MGTVEIQLTIGNSISHPTVRPTHREEGLLQQLLAHQHDAGVGHVGAVGSSDAWRGRSR